MLEWSHPGASAAQRAGSPACLQVRRFGAAAEPDCDLLEPVSGALGVGQGACVAPRARTLKSVPASGPVRRCNTRAAPGAFTTDGVSRTADADRFSCSRSRRDCGARNPPSGPAVAAPTAAYGVARRSGAARRAGIVCWLRSPCRARAKINNAPDGARRIVLVCDPGEAWAGAPDRGHRRTLRLRPRRDRSPGSRLSACRRPERTHHR